ncbi:MAG: VWA domain-containing protein [Chloroflexota bacterium]
MEQRVIEFIRGMRAAGVRISLAESIDAMHAVGVLGIQDKSIFRESLRATLVKDSDDRPVFEELFPLYFGGGGPALQNALEDLSPDEQDLMKAALEALSGRMQALMDWLTSGEGPTKEELEELARQAGAQWADSPQEGRWQVGRQIAEERANRPKDLHGSDLMNNPFYSLSEEEANILRREVQRLVTQLRSRAALRRKRGKKGKFDSKGTIRANQRYGGVPIELKYKKRKLKPSLVLICDMSRSMLSVAEFMLRLTYELQDQVAKTRSFGYYYDMEEISIVLVGHRPAEAVDTVLDNFYGRMPRHYATDFGNSLDTFFKKWLDSVDGRTTVVILGDARNNYNSPRIDLMKQLQRRARRLVWFNPEHPGQWGTGDSDMFDYVPVCDSVHVVRNLAQLAAAVDKLMAGS